MSSPPPYNQFRDWSLDEPQTNCQASLPFHAQPLNPHNFGEIDDRVAISAANPFFFDTPASFGIGELPAPNGLLGSAGMFESSWHTPQVVPPLHEHEGVESRKAGPPGASRKKFSDQADPWDPLRVSKSKTAPSTCHDGTSLDSGYFSGIVFNRLMTPDKEERKSIKSARQIEDDCPTDLTLDSMSIVRNRLYQSQYPHAPKLIMGDGGFERSIPTTDTGNPFNNGTLTFKVLKGRRRRALNKDERQHANLVRKGGACAHCRKRKSKVCIRRPAMKTLRDL